MPYSKREELPKQVTSPLEDVPHAQDIWMEAYNSAHEQYEGDEERAARVAWAAVKNKYKKGEDDKWHPKE
ncbi:MAG: ChaB family protein [Candidatus Paceibacterota bacterium]